VKEMALGPLATSFAALPDPGVDRTKAQLLLLDMVLIVNCARLVQPVFDTSAWGLILVP